MTTSTFDESDMSTIGLTLSGSTRTLLFSSMMLSTKLHRTFVKFTLFDKHLPYF